jgi:hypothetical protein
MQILYRHNFETGNGVDDNRCGFSVDVDVENGIMDNTLAV